MSSFTLDTNYLIDVDENRPAQGDILTLIEEARRGEADIAMLASSACERQAGGAHLSRFADFQRRLIAVGLGDIALLRPIARHGFSFHGFAVMDGYLAAVVALTMWWLTGPIIGRPLFAPAINATFRSKRLA